VIAGHSLVLVRYMISSLQSPSFSPRRRVGLIGLYAPEVEMMLS